MKILVVSNLYPPDVIGGYELGCRQAVEALQARGHDVRVLTSAFRRYTPSDAVVHRRLQVSDIWSEALFQNRLGVNSHLLQAESHRVNPANVHALLDEVADFAPDVVYLWMLVGIGGLGLLAAIQHQGLPWVWHLMDDVPRMLCTSGDTIVDTFQETFNTRLHGDYLACSRQLVDEVESQGFLLGDRVRIVPNWIDHDLHNGPNDAPHHTRPPGSPLRILSAAGQVDCRGDKGIDLLVEAASLLLRQGQESFQIDIFGHVADGSIPGLIQQFGVESHVRLLGPKPQKSWVRESRHYDLFAFPTRAREPFGFAALEAASQGCVPVVSQICGISEWLVHGVHCLKAPRRVEAFAHVFKGALNGDIDLEGLSRRTAAAVRRDFHIRTLVKPIEQALLRAAQHHAPPAGTPDQAFRLSLLADRLTQVLWQAPMLS